MWLTDETRQSSRAERIVDNVHFRDLISDGSFKAILVTSVFYCAGGYITGSFTLHPLLHTPSANP